MAGCNYAAAKSHEMRFAALALMLAADADQAKKDDPKVTDPKKAEDAAKAKAKEKEPELKLPDEFLGQAIKEVVMHEVGHSLGLRHNFKASTMLRPDQINDTSITRVKGMTGSVMDYNPINVAPKGQKQGDYCSTTIGPYDYWAIEYAYSSVMGNEEEALKKIAARSPDPDLTFATDDDFGNNDPQVNTYDLTSDTLAYGKMRMAMASELLKDLDRKVVKDGDLRGAGSAGRSWRASSSTATGRTWRPNTSAGSRSTATSRAATRPATRSRPSPAPASARQSSCWSTSNPERQGVRGSRPPCSGS